MQQTGVDEVASSVVDGYRSALNEAAHSQHGLILMEEPGESCRDCCVRQRWKWSLPISVLGLACVALGAFFSARADNEEWIVAFFVFLGGIVVVVIAVAIPVLMTWVRNRGGLRTPREMFTPIPTAENERTVDDEVETGSVTEVELSAADSERAKQLDHDFESEL